MVGKKSIAVMIFLFVSLSSYAHDGDRIDQLEQEIQDTKERISKLESMLQQKGDEKALVVTEDEKELVVTEDGWKSVANWKKLTTGMSTTTVREILGEPKKIDSGYILHWSYGNGGIVSFYDEKLHRWSEP
jgi:phage pi2 protein 07